MSNTTKQRKTREEYLEKITNLQLIDYINYRGLQEDDFDSDSDDEIASTTRNYLNVMRDLEVFIKARKGLDDEGIINYDFLKTTLEDLEGFSRYILKTLNNKASSHNTKIAVVRAFLNRLNKINRRKMDTETRLNMEDLVKDISTLERKVVVEEELFFTVDEMAHLHRFILTKEKLGNRERLLALFLLYRDTADRRDEVRNLTFSDLNLSDVPGESWAISYAKKTKAKKKHFLKEDTVAALRAYIDIRNPKNTDEKYVFLSNRGTHMASSTVYDEIKKLYVRAGFGYFNEKGNAVSEYVVHSLRHTSITETVRIEGIFAGKIKAGHSDIRMTTRYSHVTDDDRKKTSEVAFVYSLDI